MEKWRKTMEKNKKNFYEKNNKSKPNRSSDFAGKFSDETVTEGLVIGRNAVRELLKSGRDIDKIFAQC